MNRQTALWAGQRGVIPRSRVHRTPPNPSGRCLCGCGQPTAISDGTDASKGWVRGEHVRYVRYHGNAARRGMRYRPHPPEWRWTRDRARRAA